MAARVPLCVVGGGSIGLRHIQCAVASDKVQLTAVVEPDAARRAVLRDDGLPAVADVSEVTADTQAAIVSTPTPNHAAVAMACLDRGWAVLVEKPLTETVAEADALCAHAATKDLPLVAGHHRRCHPFVAQARAGLAELGQLVALQGIWSLRKHDSYFDVPWRRTDGAGPIMTNLSHEVDLLQHLAGPIVEVGVMSSNAARGLDVEDTAAVSLRFANGALGTFILSDAGASPWAFEAATGENPAIAVRGDDPLRFIGTGGSLSFPSLDMWTPKGDEPPDWQHRLAHRSGAKTAPVDGIAAQLDRFAGVVNGAPDDVLATGADGRSTMLVLDAIQLAARTGQTQKVAT